MLLILLGIPFIGILYLIIKSLEVSEYKEIPPDRESYFYTRYHLYYVEYEIKRKHLLFSLLFFIPYVNIIVFPVVLLMIGIQLDNYPEGIYSSNYTKYIRFKYTKKINTFFNKGLDFLNKKV